MAYRFISRAGKLHRLRRFVRMFARNERAASAVEFAMVGLPLFAVLFAALQTAIVLMAEQELQTAVEESARLVMTGQVQSGSTTQQQFGKDVCNYLVSLFNCSNLMVNMQTVNSFSAASTSAPTSQALQTNQWSYQSGTAGSVVVLQVMYEWPVIGGIMGYNLSNLSNGKRLLMATAVFQNEPQL